MTTSTSICLAASVFSSIVLSSPPATEGTPTFPAAPAVPDTPTGFPTPLICRANVTRGVSFLHDQSGARCAVNHACALSRAESMVSDNELDETGEE